MSTHNIQFHDKIRKKKHKKFVFLSYWKDFVGTEKKFESSTVNEPSGFEPLRLYCIYTLHQVV